MYANIIIVYQTHSVFYIFWFHSLCRSSSSWRMISVGGMSDTTIRFAMLIPFHFTYLSLISILNTYSTCGSQENEQISTSNIDYLVSSGLELNRMYVYRGCAPTRSSFQSGRLPVHVTMDNGDGITEPNHGIYIVYLH